MFTYFRTNMQYYIMLAKMLYIFLATKIRVLAKIITKIIFDTAWKDLENTFIIFAFLLLRSVHFF